MSRNIARLIVFAATVGVIVWAMLNRSLLDPAALDRWMSGLGVFGAFIFILLYAVTTIAFLPGSLLALAGGAFFGPVWGSMINLFGATVGAGLSFLISRFLAGEWVANKTAGRLKRLIDGVEAEGWRFVAFVRLVPLFPFNLTNYALGLTRIGFSSYIIASIFCMAPGAIAYTWLGHAGREALAGDASAIRYGLPALGLLAAIVVLPRLIKRLRQGTVRWIEAGELREKLQDGAVNNILDIRERDEFTGPLGHIPGAKNIPLGELENRLEEIRANGSAPMTIVCRTHVRSAKAYTQLQSAGIKHISVLRGGMEHWNNLGFAGGCD